MSPEVGVERQRRAKSKAYAKQAASVLKRRAEKATAEAAAIAAAEKAGEQNDRQPTELAKTLNAG